MGALRGDSQVAGDKGHRMGGEKRRESCLHGGYQRKW